MDKMLVTTEWLAEHLGDPDVRVVDIRGYVVTRPVGPGVEEAEYRGARDEYLAAHIPARSTSTGRGTSSTQTTRCPCRSRRRTVFAEAMAARGIGDDTHVIAVDHAGGQYATRLWWALDYYGHENVSVLDGGWNRWVDEGRPTEAGEVEVPRAVFTPKPRATRRITADALADLLGELPSGLADSSTLATRGNTPAPGVAGRGAGISRRGQRPA